MDIQKITKYIVLALEVVWATECNKLQHTSYLEPLFWLVEAFKSVFMKSRNQECLM